ncbi:MAG: alpha/beta hydrolase [Solobacterium sp.]|nr:alpha/beta hydrolase [Solobacterium sp.]
MLYHAQEKVLQINGNRFNYFSFGTGERPMILISGLNLQDVRGKSALLGLAWMYREFCPEYTVYCFDRGEILPEHVTIEEIAEDLALCMEYLHLSDACVLGVSQGGMIAQYLAINHPQLVHRLVLGVTSSRANDSIRENIERWCALVSHGKMTEVFRDYMTQTYSDQYQKKNGRWIPLLSKVTKMMSPERFITLAESCLTMDAYDKLTCIQCPVLVLGGMQDKIVTPEASLEIAEKLQCQVYMYENYGHSAYEEEADDFNRRVREFFHR